MDAVKIETILRTITILDALNGGGGQYRIGEIAQWARMHRATCDRYLRKMQSMGLIEVEFVDKTNWGMRLFSITSDGSDFYHAIY